MIVLPGDGWGGISSDGVACVVNWLELSSEMSLFTYYRVLDHVRQNEQVSTVLRIR